VRPENKPPELCKNLQSPVKEEESDSQNNDENLLLPVPALEEGIGGKPKQIQKITKRKTFQDYQSRRYTLQCHFRLTAQNIYSKINSTAFLSPLFHRTQAYAY
jgi:hypothetical protein